MSTFEVSIINNVVEVVMDDRYIGFSDIPKEFNSCDVSVFIESASDFIRAAIENAMENKKIFGREQ